MTRIVTRHGDMLDVKQGILVHGCNARGSMGAGIALTIKNRFPAAFKVYDAEHRASGLKLGTVTQARIADDLIIVNAVTQDHWRSSDPNVVLADYDAIESAFGHVRKLAEQTSLPVHFPLIGCGLARGTWEEVAPRIDGALGPDISKTLWLFKPPQ